MKMNYWSKEDEDFVRLNYGKISRSEISKRLPDRTFSSIIKKAKKLGISAKDNKLSVAELNKNRLDGRVRRYKELKRTNSKTGMLNDARRRAKIKGLEFSITVDDIFIPEKCPILGIPLKQGNGKPEDGSPSLDRIDPAKGYTKENVWVISYKANRIKNNATIEELHLLSCNVLRVLQERKSGHSNSRSKDITPKTILVIGDSCEDRWYSGSIRLNPEAPTIAFKINERHSNLGMAGNVFSNLLTLEDGYNHFLLTNDDFIFKTRYVDSQSGYILFRVDDNDKVFESLTLDKFYKFLNENKIPLKNIDAIVFSDYNKGFLTEEIIYSISLICEENNIKTFLDTKKILGDWSKKIDFVKINKKEFENQLIKCPHPESLCKNLIVTLGGDGVMLFPSKIIFPTETVEVRDVSGCGDSFLSGLVIRYCETNDLPESIKYANKVAAVAASKHGVVAVQKSEIK